MARPVTKVLKTKENKIGCDLLKKYSLEYSEEIVPLSKIDRNNTLLQTRQEIYRADKSTVLDYSEDMKAGDGFPAPIYARKPDGTYLTACGNHRSAAARHAGFTKIDGALVVHLPAGDHPEYPTMVEKLRAVSRRDNNTNGLRTSKAELFDGVARDIIRHNGGADKGMPQRQLMHTHAQRNGYNHLPSGVIQRVAAAVVEAKCRRLNVQAPETLASKYGLWQLSHLEKFNAVLVAASEFKGRKLPEVLKDIKSRGLQSEEALKVIRDASTGFGQRAGSKFTSVARLRIAIALATKAFEAVKQDVALTATDRLKVVAEYERVLLAGNTAVSAIKVGGVQC